MKARACAALDCKAAPATPMASFCTRHWALLLADTRDAIASAWRTPKLERMIEDGVLELARLEGKVSRGR